MTIRDRKTDPKKLTHPMGRHKMETCSLRKKTEQAQKKEGLSVCRTCLLDDGHVCIGKRSIEEKVHVHRKQKINKGESLTGGKEDTSNEGQR